jgi:hypothetical protein
MFCKTCFEKAINARGKCQNCNLTINIFELGHCLYVRDEVTGKLIVHYCVSGGEEMIPGELWSKMWFEKK